MGKADRLRLLSVRIAELQATQLGSCYSLLPDVHTSWAFAILLVASGVHALSRLLFVPLSRNIFSQYNASSSMTNLMQSLPSLV